MTYGYIRVSSDKQTVENQRFEILAFSKSQGIVIDGWIEETVSGTTNYDKRDGNSPCKGEKRRPYHLFRDVSTWKEFIYDNGNPSPVYDEGMSSMDDQRWLSPRR